jgi:hypothetical protein
MVEQKIIGVVGAAGPERQWPGPRDRNWLQRNGAGLRIPRS